MLDEVVIRTLALADTVAVKELVLAGMAEHWDAIDLNINPDLDDLPGSHPGSRTVVADRGGLVVATGTIVPRGDLGAEIIRTSVIATLRGAGLGRLVVDALVETARGWGVQRIFLETNSSWRGPIAFWQACGFRVTHLAPGHFGEETWFELSP